MDDHKRRLRSTVCKVHEEIARQNRKWGEDIIPSKDPAIGPFPLNKYLNVPSAERARSVYEDSCGRGCRNWANTLTEEFCEVIEEVDTGDVEALRIELVQLAAVAVQWAAYLNKK